MANSYRQSDGTRITQKELDKKIREAKATVLQNQIDEHGYNFCQKCGVNGSNTRLDCAHHVSVDKCKKQGQADYAYDVENIGILCRECHKEYDGLKLQFTSKAG